MPLSLYIHYPFCANLCHYCDFYKIKYSPEIEGRYFEALKNELEIVGESLSPDKEIVETIYIGGGTPSLAASKHLEKLVEQIRKEFRFSENIEFSLEINPESIDSEKLLFFKELGVNRPVFGIQSFDVRSLKLLNRIHNLEDSSRAVYLARGLGFDNFGIDMIFGLPRQTTRNLGDDLTQLLELDPPHISYYQLTVEKETVLAMKINNGELNIPDSDLFAAMYGAITAELEKHNYWRYEISSFARSGFECRHNICYWEGGDFLGLGPSAHSFIDGKRFANISNVTTYLEKLSHSERPLIYDNNSIDLRISETIMLGLRTSWGIDRGSFRRRFGIPVEQAVDNDSLKTLIDSGLLDPEGDHIRLTQPGFPLADEIIRRLVK